MSEDKFNVLLNDAVVAQDMTLDTAMVLVKGLFNEYYREAKLKITIQKVS